MNRKQVNELVEKISLNCPGFTKSTEQLKKTIDSWVEVLSEYDSEDVNAKLDELLKLDEFRYNSPNVYYLTRDLKKKYQKVDCTKQGAFCDICNRPFNDMQELYTHRNRCSSIRYILKQAKKYNLKTPDKRTLYEASQNDFDSMYDKFLKFVYEHTTSKWEHDIITNIFNPPSQEESKRIIGKY